MKTIQEKNRMIAEFMGGEDQSKFVGGASQIIFKNKHPLFRNSFYYSELKYDTSWDWLMPVVATIEDLGCKFEIFPSETKKNYYIAKVVTYSNNTFIQNFVFSSIADAKREAVHKVVVKFIEFYNTIK